MTFIKIGSGTTNKKGYAIMNKNKQNQKITHSYTGTAAGKTQIIAKIKNTEITTTPTDIYDTTWYDNATKDNTNKWNWNNLEHSIIEEGCLVTGTLTTVIAPASNGTSIFISGNQNNIFEIDIKSIDANTITIGLLTYIFSVTPSTEEFKKIKFEIINKNLNYYIDDTLISTKSVANKSSPLGIIMNGSIIFKNAKYYPI